MVNGITGSAEFSCGTYYKLRIRYHETYDSDEEYSILYVDGVDAYSATGGSSGKAYFPDGKVTINGTTVATLDSRIPTAQVYIASNNTWYEIPNTSGSLTIYHDADGKKTTSVGVTGNRYSTWKMYTSDNTGSSGWGTSASANVTLTTFVKLSTISCDTFTMGSKGTITVDRKSSSFTHTITCAWGDTTNAGISSGKGCNVTICTKSSSTSVSWTPPTDKLAPIIPNDTAGVGTLTCETFSGNTSVGKTSITFRANVPDSVKPSVTGFTASMVNNDVPSSWGIYVKGKSQCKLSASASGMYGSTIDSYSIKQGSSVLGSSSSVTTGILNTSGTNTFTVTVTDSRGRTDSKDVSINVIDYSAPIISSVLSQRCDSNGTVVDDGAYIRTVCGFSYSTCNDNNYASCKVYFRKSGDSSWSAGKSCSNNTAVVIAGSADIDSSYEVMYEVTDAFGSVTLVDSVSTSFTTMDFKKGGKGVAIGKASEKEAFECAMDAEFTGTFSANISGLFFRETFVPDSPVSIDPNTVKDTVLNITKAGYTPIAISGVHTSHGSALLVVAQLASSTEAKVTVRNVNTNAINIAPSVEILFVKNI